MTIFFLELFEEASFCHNWNWSFSIGLNILFDLHLGRFFEDFCLWCIVNAAWMRMISCGDWVWLDRLKILVYGLIFSWKFHRFRSFHDNLSLTFQNWAFIAYHIPISPILCKRCAKRGSKYQISRPSFMNEA